MQLNEADEFVTGETLDPMAPDGSAVAPHRHMYQLRVITEEGVGDVVGQTDMVDGHTHWITSGDKTDVAQDHYHLLPMRAEVPVVGPVSAEPTVTAEAKTLDDMIDEAVLQAVR